MLIHHVIGARPNFIKVAPVHAALAERRGIIQRIIHTGQHYDATMSDIFFNQLGIPEPDFNLGVGSASHARQTAEIMIRLESVFLEEKRESLDSVEDSLNDQIYTTVRSQAEARGLKYDAETPVY